MWDSSSFELGKFLQSLPLSDGGSIAALSRVKSHMEVWWIAANGSVQNAYFWETQQPLWQRHELAPPGSADPFGGIAAVTRRPDHMEVWWVSPTGSIEGLYWYDNAGRWSRFQLATNGSAAAKSAICAQSRLPTHMNVWWIGPEGSIEACFWVDGSTGLTPIPWTRYQIAVKGSAAVESSLTGVSRIPGSEEIWWQSPQGSVEAAYWYDNQPWRRYQIAPAGSVAIGSGMKAISRLPNVMDLFWIDPYGSVQGSYLIANVTSWTRFGLAPAGSAGLKSGLTAVSRKSNTEAVWWIGPAGQVVEGYWYEGYQPGWRTFTIGPQGSALTNGKIVSLSRMENYMQIWYQSSSGNLDTWSLFSDIPPPPPSERRWRTKFKLYMLNTLGDKKHKFNFYTDKWSGIEDTFELPTNTIFVDDDNPFGRYITESRGDKVIENGFGELPPAPGYGGRVGSPDGNGSFTTGLADGVHSGGYTIRLLGDRDWNRYDLSPRQITDFFDTMHTMGRCPDGILPETAIGRDGKETSLEELKRIAESGSFSNTDYATITVRIIDINMYERRDEISGEKNYPPDGRKRPIIR
jgi:hypothetical protein